MLDIDEKRGQQPGNQRQQPNILFILTDDQGPWALGCAGNDEIMTPHLDRLAASGIRFDHFFCTSPVCSPARASILTGRIPSQHGIHDFIKGAVELDFLQGQPTYVDALADAGYTCGISGKWHLGNGSARHPAFDHWYVHAKGSGPYYRAPMYRDGEPIVEEGYITDAITDDALAFLDRTAGGDRPFYLSVHYTAPHSPWINGEHPRHLLDLYEDCAFATCPQQDAHPDSVYRYEQQYLRPCLEGYFAAVSGVDANVGRLIHKLEQLGIRENTLVVFMSDNGFNCGHHGIWGKGNGTFSLNMYDTSVKIPAIVSRPGRIPQGKVCSDLLSQYDVFPTLLEYTGLPLPDKSPLPGRSFAPILRGEPMPEREQVVVYDEYGPVRMVRTREWKYVHRFGSEAHELYNMLEDPDETANRYGEPAYADIIASMRNMLTDWFAAYVDPARDGVRMPVKGNGQLRPIGAQSDPDAPGPAFDQNRTVKYDPLNE